MRYNILGFDQAKVLELKTYIDRKEIRLKRFTYSQSHL